MKEAKGVEFIIKQLESLPKTQAKLNLIESYMCNEIDALDFLKKAKKYIQAHTLIQNRPTGRIGEWG